MELRCVHVKRVSWQAAKYDDDGVIKAPAKAVITLEIEDPDRERLKELLAFAEKGVCTWRVGEVQAELTAGVR